MSQAPSYVETLDTRAGYPGTAAAGTDLIVRSITLATSTMLKDFTFMSIGAEGGTRTLTSCDNRF